MLGYGWLVFAVVAVIMFLASRGGGRELEAIRKAMAGDPDVELEPTGANLRMHTRPPRRGGEVFADQGMNSGDPPRWTVSSQVHLKSPTTLHVGPAGILGRIGDAARVLGVDLGNAPWSTALEAHGSNPEVVRALLADARTKHALHTLFELTAWRLEVDGQGKVTCYAHRDGLDAAAAKRVLLALVALCDALEEASGRAEAVPETGA